MTLLAVTPGSAEAATFPSRRPRHLMYLETPKTIGAFLLDHCPSHLTPSLYRRVEACSEPQGCPFASLALSLALQFYWLWTAPPEHDLPTRPGKMKLSPGPGSPFLDPVRPPKSSTKSSK